MGFKFTPVQRFSLIAISVLALGAAYLTYRNREAIERFMRIVEVGEP